MKKKLYHLCVSSPEVMFRVPEDYYQGINRACLVAYHYDTGLLAYSFMSNHFHVIAETGDPYGYIGSCLLYTSPSPRDRTRSRMPSSA